MPVEFRPGGDRDRHSAVTDNLNDRDRVEGRDTEAAKLAHADTKTLAAAEVET